MWSSMDPLELLTTEHREVERLLDAFERFAASHDSSSTARRDELGRFVEALDAVVHEGHQAREEQVLFVQLIERGFPAEGGPVAVLRAEHVETLARLAAIARAAADSEDAVPWSRVAEQIRDYVNNLRQHFAKEEGCLFPAARAYLSDAATKIVEARLGHGSPPEVGTLERMQALVDRYPEGVAATPTGPKGDSP